jgi:choline dehydrogenase-like flavoprotein
MSREVNVYDFIIIGAGPSGTSAAWPLVGAGKRVLMIDAGPGERDRASNYSQASLYQLRDGSNGNFFQGADSSKLFSNGFSSPKLRSSGEDFRKYLQLNKLASNNFTLTGLIGSGGLSRIWGAACTCYDDDDLYGSSISSKDLLPSYIAVADRIGMSGNNFSSISEFIGNKLPLQGELEKTPLIKSLLHSYERKMNLDNFMMGVPLTAVISKPLDGRGPCNGDMRCIWGCPHDSIYSSSQDISKLLSYKNFTLRENLVVDDLLKSKSGEWVVSGLMQQSLHREVATAKQVLLAMGTFASTRLVMEKFLPKERSLRVLHNPAFSGALVVPAFVGRTLPMRGYGGSQLCFKIALSGGGKQDYAYGLVFDAASLPAYDLMKHMPITRSGAIKITNVLTSGLIVLMVYLPPKFSNSHIELAKGDMWVVKGGYTPEFTNAYFECVAKVKSFFYRMGAYSLPGSFKPYSPGAEVHYGCTLSVGGMISKDGELEVAKGIYVVDGSSLPVLTAKSHTFTIMANADRIARNLV